MITTIQISSNNIKFFGTKLKKNGSLEKGCLVCLYSLDGSYELKRTTTSDKGYFEFKFGTNEIVSGKYQMQFYGSGFKTKNIPDGDWETFIFVNPYDSNNFDPIEFAETPSLVVEEGITTFDNNGNSLTEAIFNLYDLTTKRGRLAQIGLFYRSTPTLSGTENLLPYTFLTNYVLSDYYYTVQKQELVTSGITTSGIYQYNPMELPADYQNYTGNINDLKISFPIPLKITEGEDVLYDFYVVFFNPIALPAKYSDNTLKIYDYGIPFNGIPDLDEYYEVTGLHLLNEAGGTGEGGTGKFMQGDWAHLQWDDMKSKKEDVVTFNGKTGEQKLIPIKQLQSIKGYKVYKYSSSTDTNPASLYPGCITSSGVWSQVGHTTINNASVDCNGDLYVGFWVGFYSKGTQTKIS